MSTLIHSLAGRLREFVGDRRRAPRRKARVYVRLPLTLALLDTKDEPSAALARKRSLTGRTRDLSETGLTLLLPAVRICHTYLTDREHYLGIRLRIPDGPVSMLAVPVRFEDMGEGEPELRYLIGVRIIRIEQEERARYLTYLHSLVSNERRVRKLVRDTAQAAAPPAQAAGQINTWTNLTPAHVNEAFERFLRESATAREL